MTWPPPPLRIDYANATVSADTHPDAHNDTNVVINDDITPEINRLRQHVTGSTRLYLANNNTVTTVGTTPVNVPVQTTPGALTVGVGYLLTFQLNFEVVTGVGGMTVIGEAFFGGVSRVRAVLERSFSAGHRLFVTGSAYWVCDDANPTVTFTMETAAGVIRTSNIQARRTVLTCLPVTVVNP